MIQHIINNDTICALATPAGGAIGVIRISGPQTYPIIDTLFRPASGRSLTESAPRTVHFGNLTAADGSVIDEVLVTTFRSPHSYTGEDSVEISCHGSRYILESAVKRLIEAGCRQAQPGEYTQRAYMNGKMDLSQAEAVADLIASTNKATHDIALGQLKGQFSNELSMLRDKLLKITSLLELELDFSDQDVNFADREELLNLARTISTKIYSLADSFAKGKAIKQGIPVAIIGKTNVGKSTLLNRLLHEDKAIVSDIHGTTRDVIEDTTTLHGLTFRFIDTAGIRHTDDAIERLGIERTYRKLSEASIVIWVVDTQPTAEELADVESRIAGKKLIVARNKIDSATALDTTITTRHKTVAISAKQGTHIAKLEEAIYEAADIPAITENDVIITSARHYAALLRAHQSITRVIDGLTHQLSGDLLSEDLRQCIEELGEITGSQITPTEVLHSIFSHFCIGK